MYNGTEKTKRIRIIKNKELQFAWYCVRLWKDIDQTLIPDNGLNPPLIQIMIARFCSKLWQYSGQENSVISGMETIHSCSGLADSPLALN